MLLISALVSGIGLGSMYGLIALGFYLTYAVSGTVNFAQGSSMMLGAVLTFAFARTLGWPYPLAVALALLLCALYGLLVEFVAVRPFVRRGSDAWLMATVALGIVLDNVVLFTYGKEPRALPSPLAQTPIELGGVGLGVYPLQVLIPEHIRRQLAVKAAEEGRSLRSLVLTALRGLVTLVKTMEGPRNTSSSQVTPV